MDKPLTIDDFKDVEITQEWGGLQYLCIIAKLETERLDAEAKKLRKAKGKVVMPINQDRLPAAGVQEMRRIKKRSGKKRYWGGEMELPVKKDHPFAASITVEDPPAAKLNGKSPCKRIKIVTAASTSGELSDKGDQICGDGGRSQQTHHQLPLNFQKAIREIGGSDCRLVLEKRLRNSDVSKEQARFSMPPKKVRPGSLELNWVAATSKGMAVPVRFIEPSGKELKDEQLVFKKWKLKTSSNYVLNGKWNPVATRNRLRVHDMVNLWSFRVRTDQLGFALVNLTQQEERIQKQEEEEETRKKSITFFPSF